MGGASVVLTVTCPDRTGIVAAVTGFIAAHGGWVVEAAQHGDLATGRFFQRIEVMADSLPSGPRSSAERFAEVAAEFAARLAGSATPTCAKRVVMLVAGRTTAWPTCSTAGAAVTCGATSPP